MDPIKVSYSGVFKYPIHIKVEGCEIVTLSAKQAIELKTELEAAIDACINKTPNYNCGGQNENSKI